MAGVKSASPSPAFQNWKEIAGIYILKVGTRDDWKLGRLNRPYLTTI